MKVLHSVGVWLPLTEVWLYKQLLNTPQDIQHFIACEKVQNMESFAWSNIFSVENESMLSHYFRRMLRKAGIKTYSPHLPALVKKIQPDLLHSHFATEAYNNLKIAKRNKLTHVVSFYGLDVTKLPKHLQWKWRYYFKLFPQIDRVLCEGPHMARQIHKLGCPKHKIFVQRIGVDLKQIHFQQRSRENGEPLRILIAGSFREKKGIADALTAIGKLKSTLKNVEVSIIGDAGNNKTDQAEKNKLIAIAQQYQLMPHIRWMGYQAHTELLNQAYLHHLFVSPSRKAKNGDTEGGAPVSIIEMAASGMPIVSTTHCDIPFVLSKENASLLSPEKDIHALQKQILYLATHPEKWAQIAKANRAFIEQNLDVKVCAAAMAQQYYQLLKRA